MFTNIEGFIKRAHHLDKRLPQGPGVRGTRLQAAAADGHGAGGAARAVAAGERNAALRGATHIAAAVAWLFGAANEELEEER
jgi:hypothetical protein